MKNKEYHETREVQCKPIYERAVGLDIHQGKITAVAILSREGEDLVDVIRCEFGTFPDQLHDMALWVVAQSPDTVLMESTGVYWKSPYNALVRLGVVPKVANARHLKSVPGRKTDMCDAEWMAEVGRMGLIRPSFLPNPMFRRLRFVARHRQKLVGTCSSEKNRLHKVLTDAGVRLNLVVSDISGPSCMSIVRALAEGQKRAEILRRKGRLHASEDELIRAIDTPDLSEEHRFLIKLILTHIDFLQAQIDQCDRKLANSLDSWEKALRLLETIPGISSHGARLLLVEIGDDMSAFGSAEQLASWIGICPGNNESAGKRQSGRIRRGNAWVRRLMCEFAQAAARTRCAFSDKFNQLKIRKGHNKAIVAIAHKMVRTIYAMLSKGECYQDRLVDYEKLSVARNAPRWIKKLIHYGFIQPNDADANKANSAYANGAFAT